MYTSLRGVVPLLTLVALLLGPAAADAAISLGAAPGSPFSTGTDKPADVGVGDVNGDGRADVVAVTQPLFGGGQLLVLLGQADGTLAPAPGSPVSGGTTAPFSHVVLADVNKDAKLDVVATLDATPGQVTVLLGDGAGGFTKAPTAPELTGGGLAYGTLGFRVADVTGDGNPDIVSALYLLDSPGLVSVLAGDGTGDFSPLTGQPFASGNNNIYDVETGDVNGDQRADLITLHYGGGGNPGYAYTLIGNLQGGFDPAGGETKVRQDGATADLIAADLDGDARLDLAATTRFTPNSEIVVLRGGGNATFTQLQGSPYSSGADAGYELRVTDLDADGKPELLSTHDNTVDATRTKLAVFTSNPGGGLTLAAPAFSWGTLRSTSLAVGDIDGDAQIDAVTSDNQNPGHIGVLLNQAAGKPTALPVDFGDVDLRRRAAVAATAKVTNTGNGFARYGAASITGPHAPDFAITTDGCTGKTVGVGGTCDIVLSFTPTGLDDRSATLTIPDVSSAGGSVPLLGYGLDNVRPAFTNFKLSRTKTTSKKGTTISFDLSEPARVTVIVQRKKPKKFKFKTVKTVRTPLLAVGPNQVVLKRRHLNKPGRYRLLVFATDPSDNDSVTLRPRVKVKPPQ